jgi:hypothetical protein
MNAVEYPRRRSNSATVHSSACQPEALGAMLKPIPERAATRPVSRAYWLAALPGPVVVNWVKRMPSYARESSVGVAMVVPP